MVRGAVGEGWAEGSGGARAERFRVRACVFQDIDLIDILWRQDIDLGAGREIFDYSHRQKESEVDKELSDGRERGDGWRSAGGQVTNRNLLVDGETGESFPAQVTERLASSTASAELRCRLRAPSSPNPVLGAPRKHWVGPLALFRMRCNEAVL